MISNRLSTRSSFRWLLLAVALFGGYYSLAIVGLKLAVLDYTAALLWPAAGFAVGFLYRFGLHFAVIVAAAAFTINFPHQQWPIALGIGLGNASGMALCAAALRRTGDTMRFEHLRGARIFLFVAILTMPVGALNSAIWLYGAGRIGADQFAESFFFWYLGDLAGVLMVAPFILAWPASVAATKTASFRIVLLVLIASCSFLYLGFVPLGTWLIALAFVPFLTTIRVAATSGAGAASMHLSILLVFVVYSLLQGTGPSQFLSPESRIFGAWGFLMALAVGVLMTAGIINERKTTMKLMEVGEASYKALVEDNPALICRFHRDGRLGFANETFRRQMGLETGHTACADFYQVSGLSVVSDFLDRLEHMQANDPAVMVDCLFRGRWYRWSARAVSESSGVGMEFHAVGLDVTDQVRSETERRRIEGQAVQTQKFESVGLIAGGIAHEFNNLFTTVIGNAELAEQMLPASSEIAPMLQDVRKSAQRAAELTQQLLNYSGRNTHERGLVDLSEVVRSVRNLLGVAVPKRCRFEIDLAENLPLVEGDDGRLRQLLMSLVSNAGEAADETNGTVTLQTRLVYFNPAHDPRWKVRGPASKGWHVLLQIDDAGTGMKPGVLARIFEPFFTTKVPGRGLGLAAVLRIVHDHGGGIGVCSREGRGTSIRVIFPARDHIDTEPDNQAVHALNCSYCGTLDSTADETPPEGYAALPPYASLGEHPQTGWSSHVRSRSQKIKLNG